MNQTKCVAVIPARAGSKRIPNKNIKLFKGEPVIGRTIKILHDTEIFSRIIVSTDSPEIVKIAEKYGAEAPFLRDRELSNDVTLTVPVIADAVTRTSIKAEDSVCCVYATNPLLKARNIRDSFLLHLNRPESNFVFPIVKYPYPIQRSLIISSDWSVKLREPNFINKRSQEMPDFWHDASSFYWAKAAVWLRHEPLMEGGLGYPIDAWDYCDINTLEDWERLEILYKVSNNLD